MVHLSLCMIVKNEELYLERCLRSVQNLVDEMIVVDTGSTDKTKEIAQSCGARVADFTWCDDFSAAKNYAVSLAKGKWILSLDGDEFLDEEGCAAIRACLKNVDVEMGGFTLEQRNYVPAKVAGAVPNLSRKQKEVQGVDVGAFPFTLSFHPVRLFRKGVQFMYRVHEQVEPDLRNKGFSMEDSGAVIHHFGSVKDVEIMEKKAAYYKQLLLLQLRESPGDARIHYLVGKMHKDEQNWEEAVKHFHEVLTLDNSYKNPYRELGVILSNQRKYEEAEHMFSQAVERRQEDIASWNNLAVIKMHLRKFDEARDILLTQLDQHQGHKGLLRNLDTLNRVVKNHG